MKLKRKISVGFYQSAELRGIGVGYERQSLLFKPRCARPSGTT
jgi:hypothetical protein